MPKFDDLDDDEKSEQAKIMAAAAAKSKETARLALEAQTQKAKEKMEQAAREKEEKDAAEAKAWDEAKAKAAAREAQKATDEDKAKAELTPGQLVLQAIDTLAVQVAESDEHLQRCERLQTVLGDTAATMRKRARKKSKDLEEQLDKLMDGALEEAFKQFDTDGSGTLDAEEIIAAYKAAGMPVNEANLTKAMKLLDNNGDGVIDFDEFKQIAVKMKKSSAEAAA